MSDSDPVEEQPEHQSDAALWEEVANRSEAAFAIVVRRHQAVVSAVAYSGCGDLALSEEIAQDAFFIAWRTASSLRESEKLRSWLCGIARNLAKNAVRKARHGDRGNIRLDSVVEPWREHPSVFDDVVSREEQTIVWKSLAQIPETYREPLVLFYREEQSIADVASALEISDDAVKQRLSRGREMLRQQVTAMIEDALQRTRPKAGFTLSVMAGVAAISAGTKTLAAGTAGIATASTGATIAEGLSATLATGSAAGIAGGLAGSLGGLAGGWLGSWIPAQFASTNRERRHVLKVGRRILVVNVLFVMALTAAMWWCSKSGVAGLSYLVITLSGSVVFGLYLMVEVLQQVYAIRSIRAETPAEQDPNPSTLKQRATTFASKREGRVYSSQLTLWGRPLVHFNVSDPAPTDCPAQPRIARGWIAVGDQAQGILLAIGGRARGFIAIGGVSMGVFSVGGVAAGLVSIGGVSLGLLSCGGLGIGAIALGGLAIGWQAAGGGAIGWNFACGGGAIAFDSAYGGAAIAKNMALGGYASAASANDPAWLPAIEAHWMVRLMKWQIAHNAVFVGVIICCSLLPTVLMTPLMYRRRVIPPSK